MDVSMTLRILGHSYTVMRDVDSAFIGAFGRHHPEKLAIQIARDLAPEQAVSSLLHEILHALDFLMKLGLEDSQVQRLEAGLYQALTDNGVDLTPLLGSVHPAIAKMMRALGD